ncbi:hypothetical protein APR04_004055 [Promicromonospora umidemergens]|uniref:DUF2264 domain-containing protein n=1 Tax=Promicromonospora umidemergens TaxID=629679 RepID=A0ABP8X548_9MICO|nr:DUF2264 domain-containing protein [Promicromonospora umidemergens]MCP2285128.1 hypothetical protein [Promicromonospora umidemergens]
MSRHVPAMQTGPEARAWLAGYADRLLAGVRPYTSPSGSLITLPGAPGGYGTAVDGLEGFARTFLLAGFRLAGEDGADPTGLAERYAAGLAAGTDSAHPERWTRPEEHGQAKVEAASLALILDLTRPWIWDRLSPDVQERTVEYLASVVGDPDYPDNNWVWFRIVVETFLRSVGGPFSADDVVHDLAAHDRFRRPGGWFADGPERSFDHYAGWALHLYPALWPRMSGAAEVAAAAGDDLAARSASDREHLARYLDDALALVGSDGSPLIQGRSLTYRFAAAAPFWAGAFAGVGRPGQLREAATRIVRHFAEHEVPGPDGLLTLGWHHPWRPIAQRYSGPGSPYWASKGLLGLALPASHEVWTAAPEPLPADVGDVLTVATAPGWAISTTRDDGIARVINHGTDHAVPGADGGDSPLYARFGYSTATSPLLDAEAWASPLDQSVALLTATGQATHRTGFEPVQVSAVGAAAVLGSVADVHWVEADLSVPDHGSGRPGAATAAGRITTVSIVRGAWEVRLARVSESSADAVALRIGGWAAGPGLVSTLVPLLGDVAPVCGETTSDDATPLAGPTTTPWSRYAPVPDGWTAVGICLARTPATRRPRLELTTGQAVVTWPDGEQTTATLP